MKKIIIILVLIGMALAGCDKKGPNLVAHHFPKNQWIGDLLQMFGTFKLHINNYTPIKHKYTQNDDSAYENPGTSTMILGTKALKFDVPIYRKDPYTFYVNDLNSTRISGDASNGTAKILIQFEGDGQEIVGDCVNNAICSCNGAPQLNLSSIEGVIPVIVYPKDGAAVLESQGNPAFNCQISETGPCVDNVCAFACNLLAPDKNDSMKKTFATYLQSYFNQNAGFISSDFAVYLQSKGVTGPIVTITIANNGDLDVTDRE